MRQPCSGFTSPQRDVPCLENYRGSGSLHSAAASGCLSLLLPPALAAHPILQHESEKAATGVTIRLGPLATSPALRRQQLSTREGNSVQFLLLLTKRRDNFAGMPIK